MRLTFLTYLKQQTNHPSTRSTTLFIPPPQERLTFNATLLKVMLEFSLQKLTQCRTKQTFVKKGITKISKSFHNLFKTEI